MAAALYLMRSGVSVLLVEKLSPGGQMLMTEEIENYPGFPNGLKGYELSDLITAQLEKYSPERIMDEVREIRIGEKSHVLVFADQEVEARTVILATGARYRKLGIPGEDELLGRGVSYCALCDGNFFRGKTVAVVGGGNSALEESLYLSRLVDKLYLIHRRDTFRGQQCYQDKCSLNTKMTILRNTVVKEIVGEDEVRGVMLYDVERDEKRLLEVDGVFVFVGFEPVMNYVPGAVDKDANGILTDTEMRTNVPGIFAAGDIRSKSCRQVATAVGDGATAANSAFSYLEQLDA